MIMEDIWFLGLNMIMRKVRRTTYNERTNNNNKANSFDEGGHIDHIFVINN